jgi:hypothetical protein
MRIKIKNDFDEQYQLAGAGGIEPPNGGIKSDEYAKKINDHSEFSSSVHPLTALANFPRSECPLTRGSGTRAIVAQARAFAAAFGVRAFPRHLL